MKKMILVLMVVGLVGLMAGGAGASTDTEHIYLLVTPSVVVDLTISPTNYINLGLVDVGVSTISWQTITLTNSGNVGFTVEKAVWDDGADWDVMLSSTVTDGFDLWSYVNDTRPGSLGVFSTAISSFNEAGIGSETYLTDLTYDDGAQVDMQPNGPTSTENIWFRLDMPATVTNTNQQTIQVRLKVSSK